MTKEGGPRECMAAPNAPLRTCRWCGEAITSGRKDRRWHDGRGKESNCAREWRLTTDPVWQAAELVKRDGAWCDECDAGQATYGVSPRQGDRVLLRYERGYDYRWEEILKPRYPALWQRLMSARLKVRPLGLEVDHRIPKWNGGALTMDNLHFLCVTCHKAKTKREAGERAAIKRASRGLEIALDPADLTLFEAEPALTHAPRDRTPQARARALAEH